MICDHIETRQSCWRPILNLVSERDLYRQLMAFSSLYSTLASYIDIRFNLWLAGILTLTLCGALRSRRLLLLAVLGVSATIPIFDTTSTKGGMIKTMSLLPIALGSVLSFLVASRRLQTRLLPAFTTYINFAVYGNIGMMVMTPPGGTLRGYCSKITCVALFVWIVQQGRRCRWKTVVLHDRIFVFTAVSKSWIFAHAIYRAVLLTLPCFSIGNRYRLLEVYSLAMTSALSRVLNLPFEYCFGMADTLVVPVAAGWSAIATTFNLIPREPNPDGLGPNDFGREADAFLSAASLAVAIFACFKVASAPPKQS